MKLTYYGHSAFGVEIGRHSLLFDPFITQNELAKGIDVNKVPANFILLSHGHGDHVGDVVQIAQRTGATVISNYEIANWFGRKGVQKTHGMNHGGSFHFDFGRAKLVNAVHSSSMPDGSYGGNPGGYVVETEEGNFYFSGDTALTMDMKLIGESTQLKFAVLCVGDNFTMGPGDALKAAEFIGCDEIVGVHFDTYPPIRINHEQVVAKFAAAGKRLHLLKPGESREF